MVFDIWFMLIVRDKIMITYNLHIFSQSFVINQIIIENFIINQIMKLVYTEEGEDEN